MSLSHNNNNIKVLLSYQQELKLIRKHDGNKTHENVGKN